MEVRHWLAGVAAITLAGTVPASAQAPRSLFEAAPAPASPVTMGFEKLGASKPAASAKPAELKQADAKPADLKPSEAKAVSPPVSATGASAEIVKTDKARATLDAPAARRSQPRLASRSEPSQLPPPGVSPTLAGTPGAAASAPLATTTPEAAAKPMSRYERRRAAREAKRQAATDAATTPQQASVPASPLQSLFGAPSQPTSAAPTGLSGLTDRSQIDALVSHHARLNGVPESLVHRVIVRESKYNPRAVGRGGAMGLMQIKTATARGVGYTGGPAGLLDAETNLTYGIKYLAGAWRVSGGSHDRAVSHYASGYYYAAKRMGFAGRRGRQAAEPQTMASVPAQAPSLFSLFSAPAR